MYVIDKAVTLQADSCHNLDPQQMICISFHIAISIYMYNFDVSHYNGLKPAISFKVASVYMLPQSSYSDIFTKSIASNMLNKV